MARVDGRTRYKRQLWGGFCDNRLDCREVDTGFGGFNTGEGIVMMPAIFTSKKAARKQYQDVRAVELKELTWHWYAKNKKRVT